MAGAVNLYDTSYSNSNLRGTVHERVRLETYGQDLGQTSWMTADECREFLGWLEVKAGDRMLDVASGAGEGLQRFLKVANLLPSEGRLTRHVFVAERPN